MTRAERAAVHLLALALALLIGGAAASALTAVRLTGSTPLLALSLPSSAGLASALLTCGLLSGLLGGGLLIALDDRPGWRLSPVQIGAIRLWWGVALAYPAAWLLDLPLASALAGWVGIAALIMMELVPSAPNRGLVVWRAGIGLVGIGLLLPALIAAILPGDVFTALIGGVIADGLRVYVGLPLASVALMFWLMHRFSTVTPVWAARGTRTCGGLIALAGAWLTLPGLAGFGAPDWMRTLIGVGGFIPPLAWAVVAAHTYAALVRSGMTTARSTHWTALAALLFLLGGLAGGLRALPGFAAWTAPALSDTLMTWGAAAVMLGALNQVSAAFGGRAARGGALAPFWLVTGGILIAVWALSMAYAAQTALELGAGVGLAGSAGLIAPLRSLALMGWMALALGIGWVGVGFWSRPLAALMEA
jgi:hypothetical protein